MYCPRCGQQQVVEEVRFCPRCGFTLGFVAELLANNGMLPPHLVPDNRLARELSPRNKGVRQGGMLMLVGAALTPILGIIGSHTVGGEAALLGVILLILGLARMLYAAMFQDSYPAARQGALPPPQQPTALPYQPAPPRAVLPQQHQAPAPTSFRRRDTAELVAPPASVTENTTRLLDDQTDATKR